MPEKYWKRSAKELINRKIKSKCENPMEESVETAIKNGDAFLQKEKVMDAIREYLKAYEVIKDNKDSDTADLCYRLSQAYNTLESKNDENSKNYALMSLEIHEKAGEKDLVAMDYLNLGYIEMDAKKKVESEDFFVRAFQTAKEIDDPFLISTTLNAVADLKSKTAKERKEAGEIYEQVLKIAENTEDWDNYFEATRGKISIIREGGDEQEALKEAMNAIDLIDKVADGIKNKKERKELRKSLGFIYDLASDIAMELEDVDGAIKIAQRSKAE